MADKHNIPALKLLNEEITSDIQKTQTKYMEGPPRRSLGSQTQHTHSLEDHTWSLQQSTSTHTKHLHNIQQQKTTTPKHIAISFPKQFTNTVKHATHKTNRSINRATQNKTRIQHHTH